MSKVFIVRFSRYSIYKVQCAFRSRGQLLHTSTSCSNCQELFSSFFNFLRCVCIFYAALADSFDILSDTHPFVKHYFQNSASFFFSRQNGKRSLFRGSLIYSCYITFRHQSSHNRRRFCGRQPRKNHHCLHRGMQRSCGPTDSSAAPLPLGSWV